MCHNVYVHASMDELTLLAVDYVIYIFLLVKFS